MSPGRDYWDKTVAGFEAENPGVKVESNFVAFSQYLPTLTAMIAGGSLPDVFNGGTKTGELGRAGHPGELQGRVRRRVLRPVLQGTASPVHLRRQAVRPRRHGPGLRRLRQRSHHEGSRPERAQHLGRADRRRAEVQGRGLYSARLGQPDAQHLPGLLPAACRPVRRRRLCARRSHRRRAQLGLEAGHRCARPAAAPRQGGRVPRRASTASTTRKASSWPIRAAPPCFTADRGRRASSSRTAARTGWTTTPSTRCRR